MQTPTCWLRALRQSAHSSRPDRGRRYLRFIPETRNGLEKRILLSSTVTSFSGHESHSPAQVRTLNPIAVTSRVAELRSQSLATSRQPANSVLYANIPYTNLGGQPERLDVYVPTGTCARRRLASDRGDPRRRLAAI